MDHSMIGALSYVRHRVKKLVSRIIIIHATALSVLFPSAPVATLWAQQGGTLTLGSGGRLSPADSTYVETIVLRDYIGEPLKALQFRVISSGGLRLRSVERGTDIQSNSGWNLSHVIIHGTNNVDTAKVVIFGLGHTALPTRPFTELLTMTYDVTSSHGATLFLSDVLGALTRGENANVVTGPPRTVSLKKRK